MLTKISKIFHTADIHCRTYKRHKEYKIVFDRFFEYVSQNKDDQSIIVVAGDIVHSKLEMSPELIDLVSYFFKGCAQLCPTVVTLGNHDCNLNNKHRRDALSPIIDALDIPNLYYWKDSGVYRLGDIDFAVMGLRQEPNEWPTANQCSTTTKIAIYHGAVDGCKLDSNINHSSNVKVGIFQGFDIVLLGDIHKRQQLSANPVICYPGSLVQQNFGESTDHGFLQWNVDDRTYQYVEVDNDWGYVTLFVANGKLVTDLAQFSKFKQLRVRLKYEETSAAQLNKIVLSLSKKFVLSEVTYLKINQHLTSHQYDNISSIFGNPREIQYQNKLISDYLKVQGVPQQEINLVTQLNTQNPAQVESNPIRFQVWKPKKFEFSNMFSYGEDNVVDFTNFEGMYGLFAPNASGKSALLDAFVYCLYDKSSRVSKAKHILNNRKSEFYCRLNFELAGTDYFIERIGVTNRSGDNVKVEVNFWTIDQQGTRVSLNGRDRDETNKAIREYIGSYDDFILTTLSTQNDNQNFIDKTQKERKELLYRFLDLSIFDSLYKVAREQVRELQIVQKELQKIDLINELAAKKQQVQNDQQLLKQLQADITEHNNQRKQYTKQIVSLTKTLNKLTKKIDIDQVTSQLDNQRTAYEALLQTIEQQTTILDQWNVQKQQLQAQADGYDVEQLKQAQTTAARLNSQLLTAESKLSTVNAHINSCNQKITNLDKHEYDPNCEFCVKNPFVLDAQQAGQQLVALQETQQQTLQHTAELKQQLQQLHHQEQQLKEYYSLQQQLLNLSNTIQNATQKLNNNKQQCNTIEQTIAQLQSTAKEYEDNKKAIEQNKVIQQQVAEVESKLAEIDNDLSNYHNHQSNLKATIQFNTLKIKELQESCNRVKDIQIQTKAYEHYLQALSRDGVAYELLKKAIPAIENEVNDILSQLVDFRIKLEALEDNIINGYIVYDEDRFWPIELTSGMERFLLSIALRVAMINITSLSRANFLALDEGFGVLDGENLASITMLFDYLKNQFQFLLCISHIDGMKDLTDKLITIEKDQQYSKVFVE